MWAAVGTALPVKRSSRYRDPSQSFAYKVHVGVSLLDRFLQRSGSEPSAEPSQLPLLVTSCLKLADVYSEISKEYYKQDNAKESAEAETGDGGVSHIVEDKPLELCRLSCSLEAEESERAWMI